MKILYLRRILVPLFLIAVWQGIAGQESKPHSTCAGLHAGITAVMTQGYEEPSVMIAFVLLNDGEAIHNTAPESWKLVIDGKELEDSGFLFGNGPMPTGGYGTLSPGATFKFDKALPVPKYFPERREYTISWKGKDFQSPTIVFLPMFHPTAAIDREIPRKCCALHAGITAQFTPMYTEESLRAHLSLLLLNDSDAPIDVEARTWAVVIDGKETRDPWMSSCGGGPMGGYHVLNPGEHYEIWLSLDHTQLSLGDHKFSWKGAGFQSPTVTLKISR